MKSGGRNRSSFSKFIFDDFLELWVVLNSLFGFVVDQYSHFFELIQ